MDALARLTAPWRRGSTAHRTLSKTFPGVRALDDVSMTRRGAARSAPCSARTAPASRRSARSSPASIRASQGTVLVDGARDRRASTRRPPAISASASSTRRARWCRSFRSPRTSSPAASRRTWLGQVDRRAHARQRHGADRQARRRHRPGAQGRRAVAGAGADRRDRQGAVARPEDPDPRRADRGADADRDREAVRRRARGWRANGVSVIYVSHRLAEIFALCHSVTVLKDGRLAGTRKVAETSTDELIRLMVGREVHLSREAGAPHPGAGGAGGRRTSPRRRWSARPR